MSKRKKQTVGAGESSSGAATGGPVLAAWYLTLAAGLATSLMPEGRTWGLSVWSYLPVAPTLLCFLVAALSPLLLPRLTATESQQRFLVAAGSLTALLAAGFIMLPSTTHFLGDGRQWLSFLASDNPLFFSRHAIAAAWLNSAAFELLGGDSLGDARSAFRLTSATLGIVYLAALWFFAVRLFSTAAMRLAFFTLLATGGAMLNYFGYVEFYSLFNLTVLLLLGMGVLAMRGACSRYWLLPLLVVAVSAHIFAVAFVPALLFALVRPTPIGQRIVTLPLQIKLSLLLLLFVVGGLLLAIILSGSRFIQFAMLYVLPNRFAFDGYTIFSLAHLVDYVNLLIMLAPGIVVMAVGVWHNRKRITPLSVEVQYLLIALAGTLLIAFVFDPKLGMPRDWDLFSFVGAPLLFAGALLLLDERAMSRSSDATLLLAAMLGLLWLAPRVWAQHDEAVAIARLNDYIALDQSKNRVAMHILQEYYLEQGQSSKADVVAQRILREYPEEEIYLEGERLLREGNLQQAIERFDRVIELNPHIGAAWSNKGMALLQLGQIGQAVELLEVAHGLNPNNAGIMHALALGYTQTMQIDRAAELWERAIDTEPSFVQPYIMLTNLYLGRGEADRALSLLNEGAGRLPQQALDSILVRYPEIRSRWRAEDSSGRNRP